VACRLEAAVKTLLLPLMGAMLCAATPQSAAADLVAPLQIESSEEVHAAVTDIPDIIDMSHADPKTWHNLPSAAQVYDPSTADLGTEELEFPDSLEQPALAFTLHSPF
jgi:hypothetical protein